MQTIPLKERIFHYLTLLPVGLIMAFLFSAAVIAIDDGAVYAVISIFVAFLILHYVFGAIFLKAKLIFKIIIPIITALVSGGILFLMMKYDFPIHHLLDYYGYFDLIIREFLVIVIVWEITCQILKIVINRRSGKKQYL